MDKTFTFGVLSTAKIGRLHVIPAMQKSARLKVAAIASRDGERARAVAAELGIPTAYGSYEELLADPAIDAIYNPLPNHLHVPWTIRAMEAGKHVLCEKPIALTAGEAAELVAARERTGRTVAEAFMVRQHPQWLRAREIVRSGELGTVRAIHTLFAYYLDDPANVRNMADIGGGALYDIGCYAVATARFLFDAEPLRAVALIDLDPEMGIDRLTSGLMDFGEGRRLAFTCATQLVPTQYVHVLGTRRSLRVEVPFNQDPARPATLSMDDGTHMKGAPLAVVTLEPANQYTHQAEAFAAAAAAGAAPPFPIEDAVANMKAIDALFRSARSGGWETVS